MLLVTLVFTLLMTLTMVGFGCFLVKSSPKQINSIIGYRTTMSTKNQGTWDFAQKYAGHIWIKSGIIMFLVSLILIFSLQSNEYYQQLMTGLIYSQIIVLLLVIPITEVELHKRFNKDGRTKP